MLFIKIFYADSFILQ